MTSDFDVTDNYQLEWTDDLSAQVILTGGLCIQVDLEAQPEWRVAYRITTTDLDGRIVHELGDLAGSDEEARGLAHYWVRLLINAEEPLGEPVNWTNNQLVLLLQEQYRIVFCPVCMGFNEAQCDACGGTCYVRSERWSTYVDNSQDSEPPDSPTRGEPNDQ
jgi:hypothetical protein